MSCTGEHPNQTEAANNFGEAAARVVAQCEFAERMRTSRKATMSDAAIYLRRCAQTLAAMDEALAAGAHNHARALEDAAQGDK